MLDAATENRVDVLRTFTNEELNSVIIINGSPTTILHKACQYGSFEVVEYLMERRGYDFRAHLQILVVVGSTNFSKIFIFFYVFFYLMNQRNQFFLSIIIPFLISQPRFMPVHTFPLKICFHPSGKNPSHL